MQIESGIQIIVILKISSKYGYLNWGIFNIIRKNDILLLGGYEQPTILLLSFICKLIKKPYGIVFDGISVNRIERKENGLKFIIKKFIVENSSFIFANGKVGELYFKGKFKHSNIYNQYLSVDNDKINELKKNKDEVRAALRHKYDIKKEDKVLLYSGRVIDIKNLKIVIEAIANIDDDITFFITGGGEQEVDLKRLAEKMNVKLKITGFLENQEDVFKHYFLADAFILPSIYEAWGLVANEAMACGLPVLISDRCGCSLDLVDGNGFIIDPESKMDIQDKISGIMKMDRKKLAKRSLEIIGKWNFENSRKNLERIIKVYGK